MRTNRLILVVEDDQLDVMTLKRAFKEAAIDNPVVIVSNGEEALIYLQNNAMPSVILLDLNTPRMNGLEFLRVLKADSHLRSIPVVVLTTSSHDQDRQQSYALSVAGYIVKPMNYDVFVGIVRTIRDYWTINELPY